MRAYKFCFLVQGALGAGLYAQAALAQAASASASASANESSMAATLPAPTPKPRAPLEIGMFGGIFMPSKDHALIGANHVQEPYKSPAPDFGARLAVFPVANAGLELEGAVMPDETDSGSQGGLWSIRAHLILQLPLDVVTPFVLGGINDFGAGSNTNGTDQDLAWHLGLGAKFALDDFVALRLDGRDTLSRKHNASSSTATHNPEVLLGLTFMIGAEAKRPPPPPVAPADADHDGKLDPDDKCPTEPANTADGCPVRDTDGDGVPDPTDACPTEAGKAPCGCPIRDKDGDKVIDELDKCPDQPGPIEGCPDPDADHDGVPLPADKCPDAPETRNGFQDEDGCPDELPERVKRFTGVIQGIEFDRGKDTIRPVSTKVLDGAVAVLAEYPALRVQVSGHSDSDGDHAFNVDLSQRRADSVKAYFVSKGIDASRLETRGVGPDEPIADNKTAAGKQKNRRIEFKLIQPAPAKATE